MLREDRRARNRLAESAGADQRDVVLPLGPEDLADLPEQRIDVVADPSLAELAERGEVAPDLRRVDVRVLRDVLGRDRAPPHLLGLRQDLQVAREPRCHADRKAFGHQYSEARKTAIWGTPGDVDPSLVTVA